MDVSFISGRTGKFPIPSGVIQPAKLDFSHLIKGEPKPEPQTMKSTSAKYHRIQLHGSVLIDAILSQIITKNCPIKGALNRISNRTETIRRLSHPPGIVKESQYLGRIDRCRAEMSSIVRNDLSENDLIAHLGAAVELCRMIRNEIIGPMRTQWTWLYSSMCTLYIHCEEILPAGDHRFIIGGDPKVRERNEASEAVAKKFMEAIIK